MAEVPIRHVYPVFDVGYVAFVVYTAGAAQRRYIQRESKKIPPTVFWNFFPNGWEFLINFLHIYYTIISTLEYKFLFKYLQL